MKKCFMCSIVGGIMVFMYIKYKDGTIKRIMKNMKPMMACTLEEIKK